MSTTMPTTTAMRASNRVTGPIAPAVRWEPCDEFHDDARDPSGVCAGCGWPLDDHELPAAA